MLSIWCVFTFYTIIRVTFVTAGGVRYKTASSGSGKYIIGYGLRI